MDYSGKSLLVHFLAGKYLETAVNRTGAAEKPMANG